MDHRITQNCRSYGTHNKYISTHNSAAALVNTRSFKMDCKLYEVYVFTVCYSWKYLRFPYTT